VICHLKNVENNKKSLPENKKVEKRVFLLNKIK